MHTHRGALSCCSVKETRFLDKPSPGRVQEKLRLIRDIIYTEHRIPRGMASLVHMGHLLWIYQKL